MLPGQTLLDLIDVRHMPISPRHAPLCAGRSSARAPLSLPARLCLCPRASARAHSMRPTLASPVQRTPRHASSAPQAPAHTPSVSASHRQPRTGKWHSPPTPPLACAVCAACAQLAAATERKAWSLASTDPFTADELTASSSRLQLAAAGCLSAIGSQKDGLLRFEVDEIFRSPRGHQVRVSRETAATAPTAPTASEGGGRCAAAAAAIPIPSLGLPARSMCMWTSVACSHLTASPGD